jgi:NAD+ kinase
MATTNPISSVLIIANYQKPEAEPLARSIGEFLISRNVTPEIFGFSGKAEIRCERPYDLAVTLGGDGTVLFAARSLAPLGIPILPVNLGNFGFITETSVDDLFSDLSLAIEGRLDLGHRLMLEFELLRSDGSGAFVSGESGLALNDVVVSGSGISKLVHLMVHLDKTEHIEYRADGIIFSTSTGSTAYSAAAGGPILHPEMEALILNPICPFTLSHRPLVLPAHVGLLVEILPNQRTTLTLTVDGQINFDVMPGDRIRIRRAENPVRILYSGKRSFYEVLRAKLSWAGGPE